MALQSRYGERTINELVLMFKSRQINLEPGFQRRAVWSITDRRRLIQSIIARYPLPSIFLYARKHQGGVVYDVIDGKQRLETILMFMRQGRFRRGAVPAQREMESVRSPLVSIPPFGRGFSRHGGLSIRCGFGESAKAGFRARLQRLDEPTRLSLGRVASPQSPLPFHLAKPL